MTDENEKKRLIIIDSNSVIHRAFHALPPLTTKKGVLVNAVYGFLLVFFKAIKEFQPDYIAACFDMPGPTFRHKKYKEYKANRPPTPKELYNQIPKVKEVLEAFNAPVFEKQGFEADDIIGTLASRAAKFSIFNFQFSKKENLETIIITGDMDVLQLVDKNTEVYILRRGVKDTVLYDENLVKEKYGGLTSEQLLDFKALRGDPSDNIPGVRGIGEKTAMKLLLEFGSLENIYEKIQIPNKLKTKLLEYKEQAFLSRDLAKIEKQVPIDFNLEKCRWGSYNKEEIVKLLESFEFHSLITRLPSLGAKATGGQERLTEIEKPKKDDKMNKAKTKDQTEKENFSDGGQRTFKFG
jgi:DNA polymerase-1